MVETLNKILGETKGYDPMKREARLVEAYLAFKEGTLSKADAELILVDLAQYSGYFAVTTPGTSSEDVHRAEGARSVYARIAFMMNLPMSYVSQLQEALVEDAGYMAGGDHAAH